MDQVGQYSAGMSQRPLEQKIERLQDMVRALEARVEALENRKTKRGARLPESWQPSEAERKYAYKLGLSDADIVKAIGSFKAYWCDKTGPNTTKLSWTRTWQEWCRKDAERLGKRIQGNYEAQSQLDNKEDPDKAMRDRVIQALGDRKRGAILYNYFINACNRIKFFSLAFDGNQSCRDAVDKATKKLGYPLIEWDRQT